MYVENEYNCGNCTEHEETEDSWRVYCRLRKVYCDVTDTCNYQERIVRSEYGYYITTVICKLLGLDENCETLQTIKYLRSKMEQNIEYRSLLTKYDIIGPQIAKFMEEDKEYDLAQGMLDCYISRTVRLVKEEKYEDAIKTYVTMTKSLENYYGIKVENNIPENYDQKNGGHGKLLTI